MDDPEKQLESLKEQNRRLLMEIAEYKNCGDEIKQLRKKLCVVKSQIADDEKKIEKEREKLEKQKLKLTGRKLKRRESKPSFSLKGRQLTLDESKLHVSTGKLARASSQIDIMFAEMDDHTAQEESMDKEIEKYESYVTKLEDLRTRIPVPSVLLAKIVDLESQIECIKSSDDYVNPSDIERAKKRVRELTRSVSAQQCELSASESIIQSNQAMQDALSRLLHTKRSELKSLTRNLCETTLITQRENHRLQELGEMSATDRSSFTDFAREATISLKNLEKEITAVNEVYTETRSVKLGKLQRVISDLSQQLSDIRSSLANQKVPDSVIASLTEKLEQMWTERQVAAEALQNEQRRIERLRLDLDHKIKVIEYLNTCFPRYSKVKTTPGIEEFMFTFDVIFTQNRNLAKNIQSLTKELRSLEEENKRLRV